MHKHDYDFRPKPVFENGVFIPAAPLPVVADIEKWNFLDSLKFMRILIRNAIESTGKLAVTKDFVRGKMFGQTHCTISNPDLIKHMFVKNHHNLKMNRVRQDVLKPLIRTGLVAAEGEEWKRMRHLLTPMFTPHHIRTFSEGMRTTIEREMDKSFSPGNEIKLTATMLDLAYQILSDALFSGEIEHVRADLIKDFEKVLQTMGKPDPFDILNMPAFLPRLTTARGRKALKRIWATVGEAQKNRKAKIENGEEVPTDFLTLLLKVGDDEHAPLTPDEIQDQAVTFIGAGHETTSHGMTWLIYLLSQDEEARERVEAEVDALDIDAVRIDKWTEHLPWTIACFEEALRLYPPAPFVTRELTKDVEWQDTTFKDGDAVLLNVWALHRHRNLWENPDGFVPDRFMGENRKKIDTFQYLPFGTGPRVCIGQRFARQEAMILAVLLFRKFRFEYAGDEAPWPRMRITLQAENGMPMRVVERVAAR